MNRRDALKLLAAIPAVQSVQVAQVNPRDVIVLETDRVLSQQEIAKIVTYAQMTWPDNKVVVLPDGMKMRISRG